MVNYDDAFSSLLQDSGHLVPFMDAFFGFLYRRTDFFAVRSDGKSSNADQAVVGFTEGQAEKILLGVFRRWQTHADNERDNADKLRAANVPPVASEVEVESDFEAIPNVTGSDPLLNLPYLETMIKAQIP